MMAKSSGTFGNFWGIEMSKERYSIASIEPWSNETRTRRGWITWYYIGGKIRGRLHYRIFDTEEEAREYANTLLSYNA